MKFCDDLDKKKFDDFFKSIEGKKNKVKNFIESDKVKGKCEKLDIYLRKIPNSKIEKTINFIDEFNVKKANEILDEISTIAPLLDSNNQEEFKENAKKLVEEWIFKCYENYLEPKIKELIINLSRKAVDAIQKHINEKNKKNN